MKQSSNPLAVLRMAKGMSQFTLAKEVRVSQSVVRDWEKVAIPSLDNSIALAKVLECSLKQVACAFNLDVEGVADD